jgi:hypothetical protein
MKTKLITTLFLVTILPFVTSCSKNDDDNSSSYNYTYNPNSNQNDNNSSLSKVPPVLESTSIKFREDVEYDSVVGSIKIVDKGDSDITSFTISGTGFNNFTIDNNGEISIRQG